MATLRIYDCESGVLAVDLRQLIDLLIPHSRQAAWTVSPVKLHYPEDDSFEEHFDAIGKGGDQLEVFARNGASVSGAILAQLDNETGQFGESLQLLFPSGTAGLRFAQSIALSTK